MVYILSMLFFGMRVASDGTVFASFVCVCIHSNLNRKVFNSSSTLMNYSSEPDIFVANLQRPAFLIHVCIVIISN